jgi:CubicO group peptidase (beta-lactamase class C family)
MARVIKCMEQCLEITQNLHYWASAGKMMTALGILMLEVEGRLTLDDPISKYISGVVNGELITIEMLLNHTSDLYSANEDPQVRATAIPAIHVWPKSPNKVRSKLC